MPGVGFGKVISLWPRLETCTSYSYLNTIAGRTRALFHDWGSTAPTAINTESIKLIKKGMTVSSARAANRLI